MKEEKLTIENLCGGALQERINRALAKVADNVLDPNTDAKKKRSITIKLSFIPKEDDREDVTVGAEVNVSLASEDGVATNMFMSKDINTKQITISEYEKGEIKGQMSFDDLGFEVQEDVREFDPETGEILDDHSSVVDFRKATEG